jgi:hypothetical protein
MKSRVDGKWPKSFSSRPWKKFTQSLPALTEHHFWFPQADRDRQIERKSRSLRVGWVLWKLSRFAVFQNFIQGDGEFAGAAIELSRQKVVFLFQDVIFIGNVQGRQHRQPQ